MGRRRGENCLRQKKDSEKIERKRASFFTPRDLLVLFSHEKYIQLLEKKE